MKASFLEVPGARLGYVEVAGLESRVLFLEKAGKPGVA